MREGARARHVGFYVYHVYHVYQRSKKGELLSFLGTRCGTRVVHIRRFAVHVASIQYPRYRQNVLPLLFDKRFDFRRFRRPENDDEALRSLSTGEPREVWPPSVGPPLKHSDPFEVVERRTRVDPHRITDPGEFIRQDRDPLAAVEHSP